MQFYRPKEKNNERQSSSQEKWMRGHPNRMGDTACFLISRIAREFTYGCWEPEEQGIANKIQEHD